MAHGNYVSRMDLPKHHKRKHIDAGKHLVLDAERCVLCTRCVRFCDDVTGTGELRIVNRGNRSEITFFPGKDVENAYSLNTAEICPVGALTSKDFRFNWRVWYMKSTPSVCTGCSRGCNVQMDHADGRVYRYRARYNPDVNGHWLCDDGRMTYKAVNEERILSVRGPLPEDGDLLSLDDAAGKAASLIASSRSVTALLSPDLSNEDLFAAMSFARDVAKAGAIAAGSLKPPAVEDDILRKADPHPNTAGCKALGLWSDLAAAVAPGGDLLLVFGDDLLDDAPLCAAAVERFGSIVVFARHDGEGAKAGTWVFPIATHAEAGGTFTNFEGRVQRFRQALLHKGDVLPLWKTLRKLAEAAGTPWGWTSLKELERDLAGAVPAWGEDLGAPVEGDGTPVTQAISSGGELRKHARHVSDSR
jgi:NADH-quinone oxidoreductase subunit G